MSRERWDMEGHEAGKISRHKAMKSPGGQAEVCGREEESDGGINSHTTDSLVDEIIPE